MELWESEAELASDFRSIYHLSAYEVGITFTGKEAKVLLEGLLKRPDSLYFAAKAKWIHPTTREALILADLFDIFVAANTDEKNAGKVKPYPRPSDTKGHKEVGTQTNMKAALERYAVPRADVSPEEIKEMNRIFMEKKAAKENGQIKDS